MYGLTEDEPSEIHPNGDESLEQLPGSDDEADEVYSSSTTAGKILLVEDNAVQMLWISSLFESRNYTVHHAANGIEALQAVGEEQDFDLVVLDLMMPRMSGTEVCVEIRKEYALFELPILILTALTQQETVVETLELGANDFVSKPPAERELLVRAKNLITLRQLTNANSVLRKALSFKEELISMAVHDIKNPIMGVQQFSRLMLDSVADEWEYRPYLQKIEGASKRVLRQVVELLELSRIESGKLPIQKKAVDLNTIALETVIRYKPQAEVKGQEIRYEYLKDEPVVVEGDRQYIDEIVDNLMSNAVKYSVRNAAITVRLEKAQNLREEGIARLSITDKGPGLKPEELNSLFTRFTKLSPQPTGGEISTGLGLSIAKKLADLHDAELRAESKVGCGSTFFFEIACLQR